MNNHAKLATLLVLLLAGQVAAQEPLGDGITVPEAPEAAPPEIDVPAEELLKQLTITLTDFNPGDTYVRPLGDGLLTIQRLADGSHVMEVIGPGGSAATSLPPVSGDDLTAHITPVTMALDRPGVNTANPTPQSIVDATTKIQGLTNGLTLPTDGTPIGDLEGSGTVTEEVHDFGDVQDIITEVIILDPDNNVVLGSLEDHTSQIPVTDEVCTTAQCVEDQLAPLSVDSLTLNGVLQGLDTAALPLGIVELQAFAASLAADDWKTRLADLPISDPATIVDADAKEIILVDGGLGQVAMLADPTKLAFDDNLLTNLKDTSSTKYTRVLTKTTEGLGETTWDARLGGYAQTLTKLDQVNKRGLSTHIIPEGSSCESILAANDGLCVTPNVSKISPKDATALQKFKSPDVPGFENAKIRGIEGGLLRELPGSDLYDGVGLIALGDLDIPTRQEWSLPELGIGSVSGIEMPGSEIVPNCGADCLPGHDLSVFDLGLEGFADMTIPGIFNIVPMDAASGVTALAMDAAGNGGMLATVTDLAKNAPGATATVTLRAVGGEDSPYKAVGIEGVTAVITAEDALGLSKTITTLSSNSNGYIVFPVQPLGQWTAHLSKTDHESVLAAGSSPGPGEETSREYAMERSSNNAFVDELVNNGIAYGGGLIVILVFAYLAYRWYQKKKATKTPNHVVLMVFLLLATTALAGCSSGPTPKHTEVSKDLIEGPFGYTMECSFSGEASKGIMVQLDECSSPVFDAGQHAFSVACTGNDDSGGWSVNDRYGVVTVTEYYPGNLGNSQPDRCGYSADNKDTFTFDMTVTGEGKDAGTMKLCFDIRGQKQTNHAFNPYYAYKPKTSEECVSIVIDKEGLF